MTILADRQPIASGATTHPSPPPELPDVDDAQQFYLFGSDAGFTRIHTTGYCIAPSPVLYVQHGPRGLAWVIRQILAELSRLSQLGPRWDGYGAQPIAREAIYATLQILPNLLDNTSEPPQLFPLPSGGIQVEWLSGDRHIEIEIDQTGETYVVATTANDDVLAEGILDTQGPSDLVTAVAGLVKTLSAEIAAERQQT